MGEFAGYALDETIDAENDRWLYRQGQMTDEQAYELGIIDEQGFYDHNGRAAARRGTLHCNRCGSTDVRWRQQGGKCVLFSLQAGVEHHCVASPDEASVIED